MGAASTIWRAGSGTGTTSEQEGDVGAARETLRDSASYGVSMCSSILCTASCLIVLVCFKPSTAISSREERSSMGGVEGNRAAHVAAASALAQAASDG